MTTARVLQDLTPLEQLRAGRMPRRLVQLVLGLVLFGVSLAMVLRSGLGLSPWDVLHLGISRSTPLSIGTVVVLMSLAVLALWIPLRQAPGLGTIANALLVGAVIDLSLQVVPDVDHLALQVPMLVAGVVLNALGGALYIGAQLGTGPRDGLMTGLSRQTGLSLRLVRTGIEVTALVAGWLLGGTVGLGTVLYAIAVGPLVQRFLPWCVVVVEKPAPRRPKTSDPETPGPVTPGP